MYAGQHVRPTDEVQTQWRYNFGGGVMYAVGAGLIARPGSALAQKIRRVPFEGEVLIDKGGGVSAPHPRVRCTVVVLRGDAEGGPTEMRQTSVPRVRNAGCCEKVGGLLWVSDCNVFG